MSKDSERHIFVEKWNREHKRCVKCGIQDALTLNGSYFCGDCRVKRAEMQRKYMKKHPEKLERYRQTRNAKIKAEHLCRNCGRKLPNNYAFTLCERCRAKARIADEKRRRQAGIMPRGLNGVCVRCNKRPAIDGKKMCRECYEKAVKTMIQNQPQNNQEHIWRKYDHANVL